MVEPFLSNFKHLNFRLMKINLKRISLLLVPALMMLASCKKFLDVNQNPNQATDKNIPYRTLFTGALESAAEQQAGGPTFLMHWMGYWASPGDYAIDQSETTYNVPNSFTNGVWTSTYDLLFDLYQTKTKALAEKDSVTAGCAMILSVRYFQDLVDIFGNVPYSQCFNSYRTPQPVYDKAEDIYKDLSKVLDTAVKYLKANMNESQTAAFNKSDIATGGNLAKWNKLANTYRLRLCIRQSEVAGFNPAPEIAKVKANGGVLLAGESFSVNPGYTDADNKQSPFYGNFAYTPLGTGASATVRANNYMADILFNSSDSRWLYYYRPISGNIVGCTYGLANGNPTGASSSIVGTGTARSATQNAWIYPSFESMFLRAEAIARGWYVDNLTNAKTAYEQAVTENYVWLNVTDAQEDAAWYLDGSQNPDGAEIADFSNAGNTAASRAKFIAFQKYIALNSIDVFEAWFDLNRLHMMPDNGYISVNPARVSNTLPVRLVYPDIERRTNAANVSAQGNINIFNTKLFWQP
ncbi:SusD/RagB family nutrient-binding outer membrane lipoprotein [Niabella sp. CC-SYL272]|uniref:SusD/RagB family nutrient-binding outer membrane lipoprotein n=1 Tax=Niabella agricola TaxID=2891571 RepID=UPI001F4725ED|nr:SusD/RagB family nutrient-binding outer membrane lipoprotein [Niabella agricola]MCF3111867.1 SusD/RagB family nutrient-binding outer membrane lipoprotein [Niabella agricola]